MSTDYLTAADVAAMPPNRNPNTVRNWMQVGCRGIKLRCDVIGGRYFTTAEWLREFYAALAARHNGPEAVAAQTGTRERKLLEAMGVVSRIG